MKKVRRTEGAKAKYKESVGNFKSMVGPFKSMVGPNKQYFFRCRHTSTSILSNSTRLGNAHLGYAKRNDKMHLNLPRTIKSK